MDRSNKEKDCDIAKYTFDWLGSVIETMTIKSIEKYPQTPLIYAGGVMSNTIIKNKIESKYDGYFAPPEFSQDNAVGIAYLAGNT